MFEGNAALSAYSISSGYLLLVEFFFLGSFYLFHSLSLSMCL